MFSLNNVNSANSNIVPNLISKNNSNTDKANRFSNYLQDEYVSSTKAKNQGTYEQSSPSSDNNNNTGGWKYLTVQVCNKIYTYVVIGNHFRVLIGTDTVPDEEKVDEQNKTGDEKTTNNSKETSESDKTTDLSNLEKPSANKHNTTKQQMLEPDFMTDNRMFTLTGYYQKKAREIMKEMQENLGDRKSANAETSVDTEEKK